MDSRLPLATLALLLPALAGCAGEATPSMVLATTTSTQDTGLLSAILPAFEAQQRVTVKVVSVGTGRALELGRSGDADVVLVHAPATERAYMANGSFVARYEVMYNQFLLVGPPEDPAGVRAVANVSEAFQGIQRTRAAFTSRGDDSGTHIRERALWAAAGFDYSSQIAVEANTWYRSVGQGMGATLRIASELQAYCLTDDGTYYATSPPGLVVLRANEPPLQNQYSVLLINESRAPRVQAALGEAFAGWITSPLTQEAIGAFQVAGHAIFTPNAGKVERA